ncbi:MAG: tyrosine--tRNA ligase [Thermodesulfobacteriota bacterium]|nr:tyrosine--tRNA ligase [Thermodesulfobacteriota bacterium]
MSVVDILSERGFVEAFTHEQELRDLAVESAVTCYIGFDPTASSLHVGSLVPIMALAHMQRNGHRPIALVGGGTGLVGDPSGKTEMRKLITPEAVAQNIQGIQRQLSRFIDFAAGKALLVNNADWLTGLEYIPFLRDIGRHFSVNRMIKAESYRMRLESEEGLSFIEFNYMLLQAYDFLKLCGDHDCVLQMGGSDQWGNIVAGIDLVRRVLNRQVYGLTFPLITTSSGAKMGKTAAGAVWLDAERTSPYDYYQYWINADDQDVARFLSLFTFLPMTEIQEVKRLSGADLNSAKAVLAFEATRIAHGADAAVQAHNDAAVNFGRRDISQDLLPSSAIPRDAAGTGAAVSATAPQTEMTMAELSEGIPAFVLFHTVGLADSKGQARRLIQQGGGYVNDRRIESDEYRVSAEDLDDAKIVLRAGKKRYHTIVVREGA